MVHALVYWRQQFRSHSTDLASHPALNLSLKPPLSYYTPARKTLLKCKADAVILLNAQKRLLTTHRPASGCVPGLRRLEQRSGAFLRSDALSSVRVPSWAPMPWAAFRCLPALRRLGQRSGAFLRSDALSDLSAPPAVSPAWSLAPSCVELWLFCPQPDALSPPPQLSKP